MGESGAMRHPVPRSMGGRGGRRFTRGVGLALFAALFATQAAAQPGEPVGLALHWQHQAQFAGYYMALAKGFYAAEGLDVRIHRGGPDVQPETLLAAGEADFASMMLCTALERIADGKPLVHLSQIVNRSNFLLTAWREPPEGGPIREPSDLDGRRVTIWREAFLAPFQAFFERHGVEPVILPQYNTLSLFLHRGAVACSAMRYNEYHTLLQRGVAEEELTVFPLETHGVRMPEDGLYCLRETWARRPEVCRAFVRASLEGWRYARDHEEETLDTVMGYVTLDQLPTNRSHMRWMLREIIASVFPGPDGVWETGRLARQDYDATVDALTRYAGLKSAPDYARFVIPEPSDALP